MATNQLKIVISLLREFSDGNIPSEKDYGIDKESFYKIIDAMQDYELIKGAKFSKNQSKYYIAFLDGLTITIKGMEYLHENSAIVKTYKGLKEIREWLPF